MDTFGYYSRVRVGVAPTEDRLRSLLERNRRTRPEPRLQPHAPGQEGRRRLSIAGLIDLVLTKRDALLSARKAATRLGS